MQWFPRRRPRVLVCSSGGVGNVGDDAILVRTVERLLAHDASERVDVLTDERAPIPRVAARRIGALRDHRDLDLRPYRLVIIAGGGFACDWFGAHVAPRATLAARARDAGIPVVLTGQGIGPLTDEETGQELKTLAHAANAISVRDDISRVVLRERGFDAELTGDDALGLRGTPTRRDRGTVIHLRHAVYHSDDHAELAAWADATKATTERLVVGIAINDRAEAPEVDTLRAAGIDAVVDATRDPRALVAVVRDATAVVAHSYHVALFALAAGTPAVLAAASPYYEQKAEGLRRLAGISDAFIARAVPSPAELADRLDTVRHELVDNDALEQATARVDRFFNEHCR